MTLRGVRAGSPEKALSNMEARAFMDEVDDWLQATGSCWSHLCAASSTATSCRASVRDRGLGMLRQTMEKMAATMAANPDGLMAEHFVDGSRWMSPEDSTVFAAEMKAWLERTGTAPWRIATMAGRTALYLLNFIEAPHKISRRTVTRYREIMAAHPEGLGEPKLGAIVLGELRELGSQQATFDPLEARRGEAERMRAERHAQLDAEHRRKYGRPLGRPLEEMAA